MATREEVFPNLSQVELRKLPKFATICKGIDFEPLKRYSIVYDCPKYQEANQIQQGPVNGDSESQPAANALPDFAESSKEAMKASVEEAASSSITRPFVNSKNDSAQLKDEQPTCEATSPGQLPFVDDSIDVIVKERVQEIHTSKDAMLETLFADLTPSNLSSALTSTLKEEFPLDLMESRIGTIMTHQQAPAIKSIENIQKDNTTMKAKADTSFIYSQVEGSQSGPSAKRVKNIQEETTTVEAKVDTSSFYSHAEGSQLCPSMMVASKEETMIQDFQKLDTSDVEEVAIQSTDQDLMKQPRRSLDMPLGKPISQTTKETRDPNIHDELKSEGTEIANFLRQSNTPMKDNTSLPNIFPSSHQQSQTSAASSSSSVLESGEILELVELKDGEASLLVKSLELYPQLRLSRGQRTRPIMTFSYKVLIDILVMLATKTPRTITMSDKLTLEENLGAATFFGFDKEWIESVRKKVFGNNMFDVTVVEEEMEVMKAKLETCDITLEQVRKERVEIKERIAGVISQLEIVQSEFEAIDLQLWGLLEDRDKLFKKMMELRGTLSVQDKPFLAFN